MRYVNNSKNSNNVQYIWSIFRSALVRMDGQLQNRQGENLKSLAAQGFESAVKQLKQLHDLSSTATTAKRSDESHAFGVDLTETEPFERNVREQEGRRYLLWRKVTG